MFNGMLNVMYVLVFLASSTVTAAIDIKEGSSAIEVIGNGHTQSFMRRDVEASAAEGVRWPDTSTILQCFQGNCSACNAKQCAERTLQTSGQCQWVQKADSASQGGCMRLCNSSTTDTQCATSCTDYWTAWNREHGAGSKNCPCGASPNSFAGLPDGNGDFISLCCQEDNCVLDLNFVADAGTYQSGVTRMTGGKICRCKDLCDCGCEDSCKLATNCVWKSGGGGIPTGCYVDALKVPTDNKTMNLICNAGTTAGATQGTACYRGADFYQAFATDFSTFVSAYQSNCCKVAR